MLAYEKPIGYKSIDFFNLVKMLGMRNSNKQVSQPEKAMPSFAIMNRGDAEGGVLDENPAPIPPDRLFATLEEARATLGRLIGDDESAAGLGIFQSGRIGRHGEIVNWRELKT